MRGVREIRERQRCLREAAKFAGEYGASNTGASNTGAIDTVSAETSALSTKAIRAAAGQFSVPSVTPMPGIIMSGW
jgi:hypothetical protein